MSERVYPQGISCFAKHKNAPDFIGGDIIIDLQKFIDWIHGDGSQYLTDYKGSKQLKLQFLLAKGEGRPSMQVNTYKAEKQAPEQPGQLEENDDLPF